MPPVKQMPAVIRQSIKDIQTDADLHLVDLREAKKRATQLCGLLGIFFLSADVEDALRDVARGWLEGNHHIEPSMEQVKTLTKALDAFYAGAEFGGRPANDEGMQALSALRTQLPKTTALLERVVQYQEQRVQERRYEE